MARIRRVNRSPVSPAARPARFLLRLPAALHRSLAERAASEGLSLNEYCVRRLRAGDGPVDTGVDVGAVIDRARRIAGAHVLGVIVHGSRVRGDASTSSDIDVLIVVDRDLPLTRELYRRWDDEGGDPGDGQVLDAHFIHLPDSTDQVGGVWCEAAIEGVVLADATGRVSRALRDVRRAISEGRLVRRRAHGQPYWTAA